MLFERLGWLRLISRRLFWTAKQGSKEGFNMKQGDLGLGSDEVGKQGIPGKKCAGAAQRAASTEALL